MLSAVEALGSKPEISRAGLLVPPIGERLLGDVHLVHPLIASSIRGLAAD